MFKKSLFGMIFLLFLCAAAQVFADASSDLKQADLYASNKDYVQAESLYRAIIENYPGSDEAVLAYKGLASVYISNDDYAAAQQQVNTLISNYAKHSQLPAVLYELANKYWSRYSYTKARELYKYIADNRPESDLAIKGQTWAAGCYFRMYDNAAGWSAIEELASRFAGHPDLAQRIYELANNLWDEGRFTMAQKLYKYIVDKLPESSQYFRARVWVVGYDMRMGNDEAAQREFDKLLSDFAGHPELAHVIYQLANEYWYAEKYAKAKNLYQKAIELNPKYMRARAWTIGCDFMLGDYASVQEKINALVADFANDEQLPWTLNELVRKYETCGQSADVKYATAKSLYQMVLQRWPGHPATIWSQACVAICDIALGNTQAAEAETQKLLADSNEPNVRADGLIQISLQYYQQALEYRNNGDNTKAQNYFRQAITVSEKIIDNLPASAAYTPRAFLSLASLHDMLGDYQKAIQYYQNVVTQYPEFINAGLAQLMTAYCYQKLESAGNITSQEAAVKICQTCEKLIDDYPNCISAQTASSLLKQYQSECK